MDWTYGRRATRRRAPRDAAAHGYHERDGGVTKDGRGDRCDSEGGGPEPLHVLPRTHNRILRGAGDRALAPPEAQDRRDERRRGQEGRGSVLPVRGHEHRLRRDDVERGDLRVPREAVQSPSGGQFTERGETMIAAIYARKSTDQAGAGDPG